LLRDIRRGPGPDEDTDRFTLQTPTEPYVASPEARSEEQAVAMSQDTLKPETGVRSRLRKLIGRL
jgi:hypothetical protein